MCVCVYVDNEHLQLYRVKTQPGQSQGNYLHTHSHVYAVYTMNNQLCTNRSYALTTCCSLIGMCSPTIVMNSVICWVHIFLPLASGEIARFTWT